MTERVTRITLSLALCLVLLGCGKKAAPIQTADEAFTWFSSLDFPDVQDKDYVVVTPVEVFRYGLDDSERGSLAGFLLRDDEETFTILSLDLYELAFRHAGQHNGAHPEANYSRMSLPDAADACLRSKHSQRPGHPEPLRPTERAERFILAWACSQQGLDDLAAKLYDQALGTTPLFVSREDLSRLPNVQDDLAGIMLWRAGETFADARVSRAELAERFADIARNYPLSEHAAKAQK